MLSQEGDIRPPFFGVGEGRALVPGGHRPAPTEAAAENYAPAPPLGPWDAGLTCRFGRRSAVATGKLRPTPCKFFEKNLTKNFYLSPPNLSAGRLFAALSQLRRL